MALVKLVPLSYDQQVAALRINDPSCLAPLFRQAVDRAVQEANSAGLEVKIHETCRCDELAKLYFAHGASKAPNAWYTWHFYGLATDIIHKRDGWDRYPGEPKHDPIWVAAVERVFKKHGLKWGGDWVSFKDWPHWQWGICRSSPSEVAVLLKQKGGNVAVWKAVHAVQL